ncbi:hypothetical protein ACLKA7_007660 [Drosophila subpalustris]
MSTLNKRKSATPQPNLDNSLNPPPNKATVISNTLISRPITSLKAKALDEIQQQVELFTATKANQPNRNVDSTSDNSDLEVIADTSFPEEIEAMLVDYITNEESQVTAATTNAADKEPACIAPQEQDTATITNEPDKEPARNAPQEQILPRSLFIPRTDNATALIENAEGVAGSNSFTANFTASGGIIIQPLTLEAHAVLAKYFQSLNLCTDSSNAPKLKAIIEGLHSTVSTDWISAKLTSLGFGVIHVENIIGSQSGTPTNKFRAELPQNPNNKLVFKVTKLGPFTVTIVPPSKPKPVIQCFKCQQFGHTQFECKQDKTTCSKCAGEHHYTKCLKSRNLPGTCINCGGNHVANFPGCTFYQSALSKLLPDGPTRRAGQSLQALGWIGEPSFSRPIINAMPTAAFQAAMRPTLNQAYQPTPIRKGPSIPRPPHPT